MERSNCADPTTSCGLRESQVNAIMEANVAAWLMRRGQPVPPKTRGNYWPKPPVSLKTRELLRESAKASWARRKRGQAA